MVGNIEKYLLWHPIIFQVFFEAVGATFPKTQIQKRILHQIRNSMKFVRNDEKKAFVKDMKKIYQAKKWNKPIKNWGAIYNQFLLN